MVVHALKSTSSPDKVLCWRLIYALYRREVDYRSARLQRVEEAERRPLLEMPIEVQRHAHRYLAQLVAAAGGEWQLLRGMMLMPRVRHASGYSQRATVNATLAADCANCAN
jgi:hypothetical protein